ncbi:MAG: YceI family protein [Gammaproteobacteria bacterium]
MTDAMIDVVPDAMIDAVTARMVTPVKCLALTALLASNAQAANWAIDPQASVLGFETTYEKLTVSGEFTRYDADIEFDAQDLNASGFDVRVHMEGAETGADEGDRMLARSEWFDPNGYPQARFVTERIEADGDEGRYVAVGKLSIKQREHTLRFPFTWTVTEQGATVEGVATVTRLDFDVGVGRWQDDERIGQQVQIVVRLNLLRQ